MTLTTATMDYELTVQRYADPSGPSRDVVHTYRSLGPDPTVALEFDPSDAPVGRLRLSIRDLRAPGDAKIHLRELALRQAAR